MNKKIYKVLPGIYLPVLALTLWIFGRFYPEIAFDPIIDPIQDVTIRFLAGFAYNGSYSDYWLVMAITLAIYCLITCYFVFFAPDLTFRSARQIVMGEAFVQFFYWVFCKKYSPGYYEIIRSDLLVANVYLLAGYITIGALLYGLSLAVIRSAEEKKDHLAIEPYAFKCPHCQKEYNANVSYCIKCKRHIRQPESP